LKYDYPVYDPYLFYYITTTQTAVNRSFSGLLRVNWHLGVNAKIDPYVGLALGYRTNSWTYSNYAEVYETSLVSFPLGFETTFGIHIKLNDHLSFYSEAGIAKSAVQFGLTEKL